LEFNAKATLISGREILRHDLAAIYCGVSESFLLEKARKMEVLNTENFKARYFKKSDLDAWMYGIQET